MQAAQPQLPAPEPTEADILKRRIDDLERELADARADYEGERAQRVMALKNAPEVKKLYKMLCLLFDGRGGPEVGVVVSTDVTQPIPVEAYAAWKNRLPPACGKIIDALLVQPMNNSQLKRFCGLGTSTVPQMITILKSNGLVEKDGDLNRLRRL